MAASAWGHAAIRSAQRAVAGARTPGDHAPDGQNDDRSDHGADEAGALPGAVPADRLAQVSGHEGADDAEQGGDDEARRIAAGMQELGDESRQETDDDGADDTHAMTLRSHPDKPR